MRALYGLYPDPESAQRAFDSLGRFDGEARVREKDILVLSSEPFEGFKFGRREHRTVMPWLAALGGLVGGLLGYFLISYTQKAYPLPTGGMRIVPPWPDGVITYECIMLSAILTTLIALLFAARSPRDTKMLYDAAVSEGQILVGVANPPEAARAALVKTLREAGASDVRTFESR